MKDKNNPGLIGIIESPDDVTNVKKMIDNLNQDLIDSGFEQYQYEYIRRGNKIFIERT
ncbi:hypothetical protein OAL25_00540 [bacterium]|nr:hypothetical protein [bacterium]